MVKLEFGAQTVLKWWPNEICYFAIDSSIKLVSLAYNEYWYFFFKHVLQQIKDDGA